MHTLCHIAIIKAVWPPNKMLKKWDAQNTWPHKCKFEAKVILWRNQIKCKHLCISYTLCFQCIIKKKGIFLPPFRAYFIPPTGSSIVRGKPCFSETHDNQLPGLVPPYHLIILYPPPNSQLWYLTGSSSWVHVALPVFWVLHAFWATVRAQGAI